MRQAWFRPDQQGHTKSQPQDLRPSSRGSLLPQSTINAHNNGPVSVKTLLGRQVCKDHWPHIEFEMVKTMNNEQLGFVFMDLFFINRNEVVVKKILIEGQPAKMFDIVHSINGVRILHLKQLNKMIQKLPLNSVVKFTLQRPCVLLENIVMTSSKSKSDFIDALKVPILKPDQTPEISQNHSHNLNSKSSSTPNLHNHPQQLSQFQPPIIYHSQMLASRSKAYSQRKRN